MSPFARPVSASRGAIANVPIGGITMKRNSNETRRRFLTFLSASPLAFGSVRSEARARQLELVSYSLSATLQRDGDKVFADKVAETSAGTILVSLENTLPTVPFPKNWQCLGACKLLRIRVCRC